MITKMKTSDRIFMILGTVLMITILVLILVHVSKNSAFASSQKKLEQEIAALNVKATSMQVKDKNTVEEIEQHLYSASDVGTKIANAQNEFNHLDLMSPSGIEETQLLSTNLQKLLDNPSVCVPWYQASLNANEYEWKFETTYQFSDTSIPVLFTCRMKKTNELLAYATGIYDQSKGQISELNYATTKIGSTYIGGTN